MCRICTKGVDSSLDLKYMWVTSLFLLLFVEYLVWFRDVVWILISNGKFVSLSLCFLFFFSLFGFYGIHYSIS
uniref:Uncharacterized protein n=1 Tax=Rhizophora mucronata TaxID=61149 RepID=A0A2P2N504_RHIMU